MLLPLFAPLFDLLSLYGLLFRTAPRPLAGWPCWASSSLTAVVVFRLDKEKLGVLWVLPLQQFVYYRQLMYLVLLQSVSSASYDIRLRWQVMRRTGEMDAVPVDVTV